MMSLLPTTLQSRMHCAESSSPPADAPMPTIGKAGEGFLGGGAVAGNFSTGGRRDFSHATDFCFGDVFLPRDSFPGSFTHLSLECAHLLQLTLHSLKRLFLGMVARRSRASLSSSTTRACLFARTPG